MESQTRHELRLWWHQFARLWWSIGWIESQPPNWRDQIKSAGAANDAARRDAAFMGRPLEE
jgi:hypothetical protein